MQQRAYNYDYRQNTIQQRAYTPQRKPVNVAYTPIRKPVNVRKKIKRKQTFSQKIVSLLFFALLATLILPHSFRNTTKSIFISPLHNKYINIDYNSFLNKTNQIFSNDWFLGQKFLVDAESKKPQMQSLYMASEILPLTKTHNSSIMHQ